MNGSLKAGRYVGIDVYVHFTFFLLLLFIGGSEFLRAGSPHAALQSVFFLSALFFCVVLHEYGHALTARQFGVKTKDITLYPIGGVARLESIPRNPWQELAIALAGPAVNVAIVIVGYTVLTTTGQWQNLGQTRAWGDIPLIQQLILANAMLALFNMIPAFPMDGGRVLRALLATRMEYTKATRAAAGLGQTIALCAGLFALLNGLPMLVLVAVFVWFGAGQEAQAVAMKSALHNLRVRDAMQTEFHTLGQDTTLGEVVRQVLAGSQEDFPVGEAGRVSGMLPRKLLLNGLHDRGTEARVFQIMQQEFPSCLPEESLEELLHNQRIGGEIHTLPVLESGRLIGLLTLQNITELMLIRGALRKMPA
jgi:Zn-dependent protease/predicted transcriptional regulator